MTKKEMTKKLRSYNDYTEQIGWLTSAIDSQKAALNELERRKKSFLAKSRELQSLMMGVEDPVLRDILIRRFVVGQTVEQIADSLCYSVRHITRMSSQAVEEACAVYTRRKKQ